jgi:hypothetical protein
VYGACVESADLILPEFQPPPTRSFGPLFTGATRSWYAVCASARPVSRTVQANDGPAPPPTSAAPLCPSARSPVGESGPECAPPCGPPCSVPPGAADAAADAAAGAARAAPVSAARAVSAARVLLRTAVTSPPGGR